jgi:hypothetical protein
MSRAEAMDLTVVDTKVGEYSAVQAVLSDLKTRYAVIKWDVTTPKGMVEARKAREVIREWRTGLEKERQRIKASVLERGRLIDTEAKRITAELVSLETPIDALIKEEDGTKERERKAVEEQAEMDRQRAEIARKQREQDEQARMLSERRKKLAVERRDTPGRALQDILELAENVAGFPNHQEVRVKIAFIAEASL